jgi:hypothetical protein
MVKEISKYKADDDNEFNTKEEAIDPRFGR